ncbi:hypothetical protein ACWKSP_20075 [Micromonosporaceae bacterium Da 78-11]
MLDASAMAALFDGHKELYRLLQDADAGRCRLYLPAVAVAEAESLLGAGHPSWALLVLANGVETIPLDPHKAIELGGMPGPLGARHAAHEARAVAATVVTRSPAAYAGMSVSLLVV